MIKKEEDLRETMLDKNACVLISSACVKGVKNREIFFFHFHGRVRAYNYSFIAFFKYNNFFYPKEMEKRRKVY